MNDRPLLPDLRFIDGQRVRLIGGTDVYTVVWCSGGFVGAERKWVENNRDCEDFIVRPHTFFCEA